jgi:hypothetical protein
MDLRQFYKKIRDVEVAIPERFPFVVSLETADGGKPGVITEAPRYQAARMIVEGRARLASEEEKQVFLERCAAARKAAEEVEAARRLHLNLFAGFEGRPALPLQRNSKK